MTNIGKNMDFTVFEDDLYNCYQSVYAWLLREGGFDYTTVALHFFSFRYEPNSESKVGENIQLNYMRKDIMQDEYLGDVFTEWDVLNSQEKLDELLATGKYLMCWGDLFNCFWNEAYQKYHFRHCFIIYAKDDKYIVYDPFFKKNGVEETFDQLMICADSFFTLDRNSNISDFYDRILLEMKEDARDYLKAETRESFEKFLEDIVNADFYEECGRGTIDFYAVPLLDNLKGLMQQRKAYVVMVKKVVENLGKEGDFIVSQIEESRKCWEKLRMYFMKCIIKKAKMCDYDFASKHIMEIEALERSAMTAILAL